MCWVWISEGHTLLVSLLIWATVVWSKIRMPKLKWLKIKVPVLFWQLGKKRWKSVWVKRQVRLSVELESLCHHLSILCRGSLWPITNSLLWKDWISVRSWAVLQASCLLLFYLRTMPLLSVWAPGDWTEAVTAIWSEWLWVPVSELVLS